MAEEITTVDTLQSQPKGKKESVMVLVPMAGGPDGRFYQSSMIAALVAQKSGLLDVDAVCVAWREVIQSARRHLADAFMASHCEWSMWFDSDMVFPQNAIISLWKWAKKMNAFWTTGCYYQRFPPHHPVTFRLPPRNIGTDTHKQFNHENVTYSNDRKFPFELDCAGFGCMLIHRRVFEAIEKPYFKWNTDPNNPSEESSEDFHFSRLARKAGFVLYGVPEVECGHIGEAPIFGRADYERCRTSGDYIESREQYKEKPINGRATEPATGRSEDHGNQEAAGKPELAKEAAPSNF